jgi:hypothetical protein
MHIQISPSLRLRSPVDFSTMACHKHYSCSSRSFHRHLTCSMYNNDSPMSNKQNASKATGLLRSALQGTQRKDGKSNLVILSLTNYLKKTLGITREPEIRRIIDIVTNINSLYGTKNGRQPMNPYARLLTVDEATEVVEYLKEFGFSNDDVTQLIQSFPQILCYSVDERMRVLMEYLVDDVGISNENVRQMVLRRPTVFGLQKGQVEQMLGFLLNNGSSKDEIVHLLETTL